MSIHSSNGQLSSGGRSSHPRARNKLHARESPLLALSDRREHTTPFFFELLHEIGHCVTSNECSYASARILRLGDGDSRKMRANSSSVYDDLLRVLLGINGDSISAVSE